MKDDRFDEGFEAGVEELADRINCDLVKFMPDLLSMIRQIEPREEDDYSLEYDMAEFLIDKIYEKLVPEAKKKEGTSDGKE